MVEYVICWSQANCGFCNTVQYVCFSFAESQSLIIQCILIEGGKENSLNEIFSAKSKVHEHPFFCWIPTSASDANEKANEMFATVPVRHDSSGAEHSAPAQQIP
jgi:hypothetical protein